MNKRVLFLILFFAFMPFVSAQYFGNWGYGTEQVIDSVVSNLEPFFRALLGGNDWTGYLLFEKILLLILISIVVSIVLGNLPPFKNYNKKGILRLISLIIGIIGVRNLNYIWIGTILVQYQVLFISIAGILPFMIYWYFAKSFDNWVRKTAWVFYAIIYFGLWATTSLETYSSVYLWGALVALVYAFVFDSMVIRWIAVQDARRGNAAQRDTLIAGLKKEIAEIRSLQSGGHMSKASADHMVRIKEDTIRSLIK
jgi:hypothetical protein